VAALWKVVLRAANAALSRASRKALAPAALLLWPAEAWAHGAPLDRPVRWDDWNWDPVILLNLLVIAWLYRRGWRALQQRAAHRRASHGGSFDHTAGAATITNAWRAIAFSAGLLIVLAVLISPLDPLGEQLGWVHMIQHMILMTVAAPLFVAGAPGLICLCGLPPAARRSAGQIRHFAGKHGRQLLWSPLLIWSLYAVVMWIWHAPALYEAALRNPIAHDIQHLSFFIAACLFWRLLLDPINRQTLTGGLAVLYLFTTTLHATVLGVFMTIAPAPWYPTYETRTHWWGFTALEDQQLAGLIMWMPACAAYAVVAISLFAKALAADEKPTIAVASPLDWSRRPLGRHTIRITLPLAGGSDAVAAGEGQAH
jgi:putative membrane protein